MKKGMVVADGRGDRRRLSHPVALHHQVTCVVSGVFDNVDNFLQVERPLF